MSGGARRRRAVLLLSLALAAGGLAASEVRGRVEAVEARVGPLVPVVVARGDVPAGTRLGPRARSKWLAVRRVPAAYVPPDALAEPGEADGLRLAVPLERGSYITGAALAAGAMEREPAGPPLRRGERALEVAVTGAGQSSGAAPGARVDVLVTTESRSGAGGSTHVALEDVELLGLRAALGADGAAPEADGSAPAGAGAGAGATGLATLRVTARQAVFLTAAQSFAREIRLLARPPGDRRPTRAPAVASGDL